MKMLQDVLYFISFILLHLLSFQIPVSGQIPGYDFERISTENIKIEKGLSQSTVFCISQDNKGFMWFGTWDGLNRYDGYKFRIFSSSSNKQYNDLMTDETIYSIYQDNQNNLWIGTEEGINKLNLKFLTFDTLIKINDAFKLGKLRINHIIGDKNNNLWIATNNGLFKYDVDKDKVSRFISKINVENELSSNNIAKLLIHQNYLWIGTKNGLNRLDLQTERIFNFNNSSVELSDNNINDLIADSSGNIWIGTADGLNCLNTLNLKNTIYKKEPQNKSLNHNNISSLMCDCVNNIWIGTLGGGLYVFNKSSHAFYHFTFDINNEKSISSDYIHSIYKDNSGLIWIGTNKGISKLYPNAVHFKHIYNNSRTGLAPNSNMIWAIMEDKQHNIWLGTDNGLNKFDAETDKYSYWDYTPGQRNMIPSKDIRCIFEDDSGYLWIGSFDKGIGIFNPQKNEYRHLNATHGFPKISSNTIWDFTEDYNGNVWIATANGLNRINRRRDSISVFKYDSTQINSLVNNNIYSVLADSNKIWIGTSDGISVYNTITERFYNFRHSTVKNSLSTNKIFDIYKDSDGLFWIGTINGGLNMYNPNIDEFFCFTTKQGLPNNVVYNILEDNSGYLWMSTNYGLAKFDKINRTFVNFDVRDGLQSNEFNYGAACKDSKGRLYFGGMNGYNVFLPDNIRLSTFNPRIVITDVLIRNKHLGIEFENGDSMELSHQNNSFSIEFAALDFSKSDKISYAFKLQGFDKDWIYSNAQKRFAQYTNLPAGNYKFIIKATNSDGLPSPHHFYLYIHIQKAWYKTYLFLIPFTTVIIATIALIIFSIIHRIKKRNRLQATILAFEKKLFELEQKTLRLQMNPHFIFNTLNSIQSFILRNDTDKAIHFLTKFSRLMRLILNNTRQSNIVLHDEIETLTLYLQIEKLRFDDKFDYSFEIDKQLDTEYILIPPMLIQPFVENAILHGIIHKEERGHISISFNKINNYMQCIVLDNGIGREMAARLKVNAGLSHKSQSLNIIKERIAIMNKQNILQTELKIIDLLEANKPLGTKVIISIPIKYTT